MKPLLFTLLLYGSATVRGETNLVGKYALADSLLEANEVAKAWEIFQEIDSLCDKSDTLYRYILWGSTAAVSRLELHYRLNQKFDSAVYFGKLALKLINKNAPFYRPSYRARQYFMYKNMVVSFTGMGMHAQAAKYKQLLMSAHKQGKLPQGLRKYFNFAYFKWKGKNVWGFEWFPPPTAGKSQPKRQDAKIVYYVYSAKADGSDGRLLYQVHLKKKYKLDKACKYGYVLIKQLEDSRKEISGALYAFQYDRKINYGKLQIDIRDVVDENYYPDRQLAVHKVMSKRT